MNDRPWAVWSRTPTGVGQHWFASAATEELALGIARDALEMYPAWEVAVVNTAKLDWMSNDEQREAA